MPGAWKTGVLPLMRDGTQWRPMVHVRDTARAMCFMLNAPAAQVNGQIFNVGSDRNNYQLGPLAELVAKTYPRDVSIEWYGDPDTRSYRVSFDKIRKHLPGFKCAWDARSGARQLYELFQRIDGQFVGQLGEAGDVGEHDGHLAALPAERQFADLAQLIGDMLRNVLRQKFQQFAALAVFDEI